MEKQKYTYDFICYSDLIYDYDDSDKVKTEKKIKGRLKRLLNEKYNQDRIDYIRSLRDELKKEVSLCYRSKYYLRTSGGYTDIGDFDTERMLADLKGKYNEIDNEDLLKMIYFTIYLYYMR